ncbi:DUF2857 family protein [Cronobacter dublinensis]|nr:DUF2857 family protein [Cronobacter dublinensis]
MTPAPNFVVLTDALHALIESNIRHCEALGFTYDELNAINELSLDELFVLSRASAQFMNVTIHHENLRQILAQSRPEPSCSPSRDFCLDCGDPIPEKRRQLIPGVRLCVHCQVGREQCP